MEKKEKESGANSKIYHLAQYVSNACGTVALIHSVANNLDKWVYTFFVDICIQVILSFFKYKQKFNLLLNINKDSLKCYFFINGNYRIQLEDGELKKFLDDTKDLTSEKRGEKLVEAHGISITHEDFAQEGQTEVCLIFKLMKNKSLLQKIFNIT